MHAVSDLRACGLLLHHISLPTREWPAGLPRCDLRHARSAKGPVVWAYDPHRHRMIPFVLEGA